MTMKSFTTLNSRRTRGLCHARPLAKAFGVASRVGGFTLIEILTAIVVLTIILLLVAQLMSNATTVTRSGNKHIDNDTQGRVILDRMAIDFARMMKRSDLDYYVKGPANYTGHANGHAWGAKVKTNQKGNDQIAFFTRVSGYYPTTDNQSSFSLVAYRINDDSTSATYLMLERMDKGLLWNGVDNGNNQTSNWPISFLPVTIDSVTAWSAAVKNDGSTTSKDPDYETVGPQVFRFEYYYLLKNGTLTDIPWNLNSNLGDVHSSLNGWADVEGISVAIATIDPVSRSLVSSASLWALASDMADFKSTPGKGVGGAKKTGDLENYWKDVLFGNTGSGLPGVVNTGTTSAATGSLPFPPEAAKAIRIYNRYYDLTSL
jgi:prepilin-type N-terminal cleavage/methylation domain-containing protein